MTDRNGLEGLVATCVAPLSGPTPAGKDLADGDVSQDSVARQRQRIVAAFQDSRNVDWNQVYDDGLSILRGESKDFYALWAVLAPLPQVRGYGFAGVATSVEMCNSVTQRYWDSLYPALPAGLTRRVAILNQLVRRWTSFVGKAEAKEGDVPAIAKIHELLPEFEGQLAEHIPDGSRPNIGELKQRISALHAHFQSVAVEEDEDTPPEEGAPTAEDGDGGVRSAHAGGGRADLEKSFAASLRMISSRPERSLSSFQEVVNSLPTRAGKFRGQVYLGELYLKAGHAKLARRMLSFLNDESRTIKLDEWEPELCGKLWATLHQAMTIEQEEGGGDSIKDAAKKLEELFADVCRVDAKQAATLKTG